MQEKEKMPERPEEVELTKGLPITFKEHLEVYGDADTAIAAMKQRCEAGHDWVCAPYMDQIERYIRLLVPMFSEAARFPVMTMLYDVEMEIADMLDEAKGELDKEYGVEEYTSPTGEIVYRLKDMPEAKGAAIMKGKSKEIIDKFEGSMLERLGQERYNRIQEIRRGVRKEVPPMAPKKVAEREKKERKERLETVEEEIARLTKIKEELKKKMEKRI